MNAARLSSPILPTYTYPGVAGAMLALSKARRQAFLLRCAANDAAELGRKPSAAKAAASAELAAHYEAIADRITRDLASGIYEGGRT